MSKQQARRTYTVMIGRLPHSVRLTDTEAKAYGDRATLQEKTAPTPETKAKTPANKSKSVQDK